MSNITTGLNTQAKVVITSGTPILFWLARNSA